MSVSFLERGLGCLMLMFILGTGLPVDAKLTAKDESAVDPGTAYEEVALFTKVLEQVRAYYVDVDKTGYKDLIYGAMRGMLQSLDPHSQFMDPDMYSDMKEDTSGEFGGLGIVITVKDGVLTIVSPMEDTPGFRAGLLSGDKIIEIDGKSTEGFTLPEAVKLLRGEPGTDVSIKILRPKTQLIEEVKVTRAKINVPSIKDERLLSEHIGYLRIVEFKEKTGEALNEALERLVKKGMTGLVIDLRNNPGGLLTSAIDVSEKFLKRGKVIVSTQGREDKPEQIYRSKGRRHYLDFPVVILINGGSASASEIVAGALQDHRRAILVGEKSFGKGSVQSVLPLDDGSAIRLTTAKYYTPNKRVIHEKGIEPDILVPMDPEDWRKLIIQRLRMEKISPEEKDQEEVEDITDIQLQRAIDVLRGVMIFEARNGKGPDKQG